MNPNPFRRRAESAQAEAERVAATEQRARRSDALQQEAAELVEQAERFDAAVAGHHAAEAREVERLNAAVSALDGSRRALAKVAAAADKAVAGLYEAAEQHDALVLQLSGELRAAGLSARYTDGEASAEFDTGGVADGLVLHGTWWARINPRLVVRRCVYGVLRANGDRATEADRHQHRLDIVGQGLLPELPRAKAIEPDPVIAAARAVHGALLDEMRATPRGPGDDDLDRRRDEHDAEKAQKAARREYARVRSEMVAERGELRVQQIEVRNGLPIFEPRLEVTAA